MLPDEGLAELPLQYRWSAVTVTVPLECRYRYSYSTVGVPLECRYRYRYSTVGVPLPLPLEYRWVQSQTVTATVGVPLEYRWSAITVTLNSQFQNVMSCISTICSLAAPYDLGTATKP